MIKSNCESNFSLYRNIYRIVYFLILFAVAHYGDKRAEAGRSVINANVYALSIAVYCTTWTFLGSVGMAATSGYIFLSIFLGPTITMFFSIVLLKILRIAKIYNVTSISDFISTRYGKSQFIAGLVTTISLVGLIPYIALQLKAISLSFSALITPNSWEKPEFRITEFNDINLSFLFSPSDSALWIAGALALFTIIFGTKSSDNHKRSEGLVFAIAFESIVKLIAFLAVGIFVTFFVFDGPKNLADKSWHIVSGYMFFVIPNSEMSNWIAYTILSSLAILVLPRQFQIMIVENTDERFLTRAIWMFPLYLFLINLFVIPITLGGLYYFHEKNFNPDLFVISLPLAHGQNFLALFVFLGCLSAGTAMVIVEVKALSTMICNDMVMPTILRIILPIRYFRKFREGDFSKFIVFIRRMAIIFILLLGYTYYRIIGNSYGLVGMGLISFIAVAQFAPSIFGGIYWLSGNKLGAIAGLIGGFVIWFYTALLPSFLRSGIFDFEIINKGLFGINLLRANALMGLSGFGEATHAFFWSMIVNIFIYWSLSTHPPKSFRKCFSQTIC